jgi:hypothetical protein
MMATAKKKADEMVESEGGQSEWPAPDVNMAIAALATTMGRLLEAYHKPGSASLTVIEVRDHLRRMQEIEALFRK